MLSRPPSLWSVVITLIVFAVLLEDMSRQVSPHPLAFCGVAPLVLLVTVDYVIRVVRRISPASTPSEDGRWPWFCLPVATVLVLIGSASLWPMKLRFALSRTAFERELADYQSGRAWDGPKWVGWFLVSQLDTWPGDDRVCFVVGESVSDPVAICYEPARTREHRLHRQISGSWYAAEL